ncbi:MAG: hypothetical protein Q9160_006487 [Pyrenula sp. 1 TL-2023]
MPDSLAIAHPAPRRAFDLTPEDSVPPSPSGESPNPTMVEGQMNGAPTPKRTRSFLNLTSSTLFGIFSPTSDGYGTGGEPATPWGTGARTPGVRRSAESDRPPVFPTKDRRTVNTINFRRKRDVRNFYLPLALRGLLLFTLGMAYGFLIAQLHDRSTVAPVKVANVNRQSWSYLIGWGVTGMLLGSLLPLLDTLWLSPPSPESHQRNLSNSASSEGETGPNTDLGAAWNPAVRSVGAFIGIAFAIRRLPWESTLQTSLTLALANPALWYLIDRTVTGITLSTAVGLVGTLLSSVTNPTVVPLPFSTAAISHESVGRWTWIASVIFCSSICFGNIGRRLALSENLHGGADEFYWSIGPSI